MRFSFAVMAMLVLAACSDAPVATEKKAPPPPPQAITGRQAFQMTYPQARTWAADCQPMRVRSINLPDPKSEDGKAGAWEILWVSQSRGRQRIYTWSAVEAEGNLHKGVFGGLEESWRGPTGQERPFLVQALRIDTPDALKTALENTSGYKKKPEDRPPVNFLLEYTPRFPDAAWRVLWGESVSSAEWSVFVDATTGNYLGHG
jgi:hypothetical protein